MDTQECFLIKLGFDPWKKAPICGRVCMDQFMVDVTEIPDVKTGDEVTLLGKDGDEVISDRYTGRSVRPFFL